MTAEGEKNTQDDDAMGEAETRASVGLCVDCRWVRVQGTRRGKRFYRCGQADEDASFLRYPPLPITSCRGFEGRDAPDSGVTGR